MRKLKLEELNRINKETYKSIEKLPLVVVLDNIRSMHNVGSVFRTSDAFLVEKIYLCGITAKPPHKEIRKTAIGATESVEWAYEKDITCVIKKLKVNGYEIISIEQTTQSKSFETLQLGSSKKYAIVLGNEVDGVQQEVINLSDATLEIPQFGTKHSLNVSVCSGIVLWKFFEKLKLQRH